MPKASSFRILSSKTPDPVELPWHLRLRTQDLIFHESTACTTMSRNTFIIFVLLGQARHIYCFDGPAGLRLGFGSYSKFQSIGPQFHGVKLDRDTTLIGDSFDSTTDVGANYANFTAALRRDLPLGVATRCTSNFAL